MSQNLDRLQREALELSADERLQLVGAILESLDEKTGHRDLRPEEKKRLGKLWDEGIASGLGDNLSLEELIARARASYRPN